MKGYTVNVVRLIGAGLLLLLFILGTAFSPTPMPDTNKIIFTLVFCFCFLLFSLAFEVKQE